MWESKRSNAEHRTDEHSHNSRRHIPSTTFGVLLQC